MQGAGACSLRHVQRIRRRSSRLLLRLHRERGELGHGDRGGVADAGFDLARGQFVHAGVFEPLLDVEKPIIPLNGCTKSRTLN